MASAREPEVAWAAGLFEGEGCMYINEGKHAHRRHRGALHATLAMRDFDVVERFRQVVGIGNTYIRTPQKEGWSPQLIWFAGGTSAVVVIGLLAPYFGERRAARAAECLQWYADRCLHTCAHCRRTFIAPDPRSTYCSERCRWQKDQGSVPAEQLALGESPIIVKRRRSRDRAERIALLEQCADVMQAFTRRGAD